MANISIRMDDELKRKAEELFNDLGMNLTTAFTVFVKQSLREQAIPFEISREIPNKETREAIEEVQQMKKNPSMGKAYDDEPHTIIFLNTSSCLNYKKCL